MLQPGNLFGGLPTEIVTPLVRTSNDKFWVFPVKDYSKILKQQIQKNKDISQKSKIYLIGLVDFMEGKINAAQVKNLYINSGKEIPEKKIITDFGEVLGPYFALDFLKNRDVKNIVFPVRQNYEIFDFFIKNEHHYGFSSKALSGGSNTLAPKLLIERLEKMKKDPEFKKYNKEIIVLENLTNYSMFEGVVIAFSNLISNNNTSKGFDISATEMRKIFANVNFELDSKKIEKNKDKPIVEINLSDAKPYAEFLNRFVVESTQIPMSQKKDFQSGKKPYTTTNVVYGMIKYIASSDFDFNYIMKQAFQDLNIVKMGMKDGVPTFKMQSTVSTEVTVTNNNYVFRSKAAFDRVKDKLGIQL